MDDATVGASWCDRCQDIGGWTPTSASTSGFSTIWWKPQAFQRLFLSSWFHFTCLVCLLSSVTRWAHLFEWNWSFLSTASAIHRIPRDSQFLGLRSGLILRQIPQRCLKRCCNSLLESPTVTLMDSFWRQVGHGLKRVRNHHTLLDHNTSNLKLYRHPSSPISIV